MVFSLPPLAPWLTWSLPMIGALLTPVLARFSERLRDYAAVSFSLLAALSASMLLPDALAGKTVHFQLNWIPSLGVKAGVLVDPLSAYMANIVAWISFLIMVYSLGYMHGDRGLTRYWFFMNFFIGNMLLLVLSDNFLQMLFGWEGVGLCSYALIGYYHGDQPEWWVGTPGDTAMGVPMAYSPSHAGMKAFIMTRIGDIGLIAGVLMIYSYAGTFDFTELGHNLGWAKDLANAGLLLPVALLLFAGPLGKSAQFPLHEWLPDAMAGPTPVSALIHAATMVKAGVFLMARIGPIFYAAILIQGGLTLFFETVAWVGAFTAFLAATQAMVSKEVKKVMAYSTTSQIGYMMLAIGVAGLTAEFAVGYVAGMFHLASHAIFKASLFLASGALLHACESRFMDDMGGLRKEMHITFLAMVIGAASLSGVPPLSGFWSKDAILVATLESGRMPLFLLAAVTAALTVFYSVRMIGKIFLGEKSQHLKKLESEGKHIHEAPKVMWLPYVILAAGTAFIGLGGPMVEKTLQKFLGVSAEVHKAAVSAAPSEASASMTAFATSAVVLLVGGGLGYYVYVANRIDPAQIVKNNALLRGLYRFFWNRWYMNPIYYRAFTNGAIASSRSLWNGMELAFFDRINYGVASGGVGTSKLLDKVDLRVIDGFINGIASAGKRFSEIMRRLQTGIVHQYVFAFVMGMVLLTLFLVLGR